MPGDARCLWCDGQYASDGSARRCTNFKHAGLTCPDLLCLSLVVVIDSDYHNQCDPYDTDPGHQVLLRLPSAPEGRGADGVDAMA
jgi:hypothetical protein